MARRVDRVPVSSFPLSHPLFPNCIPSADSPCPTPVAYTDSRAADRALYRDGNNLWLIHLHFIPGKVLHSTSPLRGPCVSGKATPIRPRFASREFKSEKPSNAIEIPIAFLSKPFSYILYIRDREPRFSMLPYRRPSVFHIYYI